MSKNIFFMILAVLLVGFTGGMINVLARERSETKKSNSMITVTPTERQMPSFRGATQWFNSSPLMEADLRGKVVLVEFWTYTCINWRRTLPYVRAWAEKYKDQGLVVVGVHTPEFSFEKDAHNVQWALKDMTIDFPVAMDNNYGIWNAFENQYWPAMYFIDAKGNIRHHQFGEGNYEQSEKVIQQLLMESGTKGVSTDVAVIAPAGPEVAADWSTLGSPENYLGFERTANFASTGGAVPDERQHYVVPARLRLNQWALSGNWTMGSESDVLNLANGQVVYRFRARDVNLIMGPATPGMTVRFRVTIDGKPAGDAHGVDVDGQGNGVVTEQRMYQLVRQSGPIAEREVTIEFLDPGVAVFDFTFG